MFAQAENTNEPRGTAPAGLDASTEGRGADLGDSFDVAAGGGRSSGDRPMVGPSIGVVVDWNKLEAGGSWDILPKDIPWPKFPLGPLPYPLCNATITPSMTVDYAGGGDLGTRTASLSLGGKGAVVLAGQIEAGPLKAGLEGELALGGKVTINGSRKEWSLQGFSGLSGGINIFAAAGFASVKWPICAGEIGRITGINISGRGATITRAAQVQFQWGSAIQNLIDWVKARIGGRADGGAGGADGTALRPDAQHGEAA